MGEARSLTPATLRVPGPGTRCRGRRSARFVPLLAGQRLVDQPCKRSLSVCPRVRSVCGCGLRKRRALGINDLTQPTATDISPKYRTGCYQLGAPYIGLSIVLLDLAAPCACVNRTCPGPSTDDNLV
jgi:hypothetical protein